jgi:hypothetical protein
MPISGLDIGFEGLINSRPLGLFYNPHLSAYVVAIYFIFKSIEKKNKLFDMIGGVVIFMFGSKFTLFAFMASFLSKFKILFNIFIILCGFFVLIMIVMISDEYLYLFPISARFILQQMIDLSSYKALLNFYPIDYTSYLNSQMVTVDNVFIKAIGNQIGNEIQLFTLYIEGGFILATLYLYNLYNALPHFKIFLFVSLIHYGFATTPFILFMMINYENIISKTKQDEVRNIS